MPESIVCRVDATGSQPVQSRSFQKPGSVAPPTARGTAGVHLAHAVVVRLQRSRGANQDSYSSRDLKHGIHGATMNRVNHRDRCSENNNRAECSGVF